MSVTGKKKQQNAPPLGNERLSRRALLLRLLGLTAVTVGAGLAERQASGSVFRALASESQGARVPFRPLRGPIPLPNDGLSALEQRSAYGRVALKDELLVPEGFLSELLLQWGDPLGEGRFGFNNDHIAFIPLDGSRALLTVNFEYISPRPWAAGYQEVMGRALPFEVLREQLSSLGGSVHAPTLAAEDPLRRALLAVATAALEDVGIGVAELERDHRGWRRRGGRFDRRLHGLTGLNRPEEQLRTSGPAAAVFRRQKRLG